MTEYEKFMLEVDLENLQKEAGTDHPQARLIGCRIAEIKNLLSPKPVPQIEEQLNLELVVPLTFDELFGVA
jgi:hypothetical protein